MKVNFEEIQKIVEGCYRVATKADLPSFGSPMSCPVRSMVFQTLLNHLIPSNQIVESSGSATIKVDKPKEEWQE